MQYTALKNETFFYKTRGLLTICQTSWQRGRKYPQPLLGLQPETGGLGPVTRVNKTVEKFFPISGFGREPSRGFSTWLEETSTWLTTGDWRNESPTTVGYTAQGICTVPMTRGTSLINNCPTLALRGTSLIRNRPTPAPYSTYMSRALWWS